MYAIYTALPYETNLRFTLESNNYNVKLTSATYYIIQDIFKKRLNPQKQVLLYLCALLLAQSFASEPNPRPRTPKHPCGICNKAVTWKTAALCCDTCDKWYHKDCMGINTLIYHNVSWPCDFYGTPNFTSSILVIHHLLVLI